MSDESSFVKDWWQQIVLTGGILYAIVKTHIMGGQMQKMLYDNYGVPRVKWADDCDKCRIKCQDDIHRELQNIHVAITELHKAILSGKS